MKKSVSIILALSSFMAFTAQAQQTGQTYLQLDGGLSIFNDTEVDGFGDTTYDLGFSGGVRAGYHLDRKLRLEGDISASFNEVDEIADTDLGSLNLEADLLIVTFGIAIYADLFQLGTADAYAGGGIGGAYKEIDTDFAGDSDDTDLYAHAEVGTSFNISPGVSLVPHYRLVWFDEFGDDAQFAHWLRLGLRFTP